MPKKLEPFGHTSDKVFDYYYKSFADGDLLKAKPATYS